MKEKERQRDREKVREREGGSLNVKGKRGETDWILRKKSIKERFEKKRTKNMMIISTLLTTIEIVFAICQNNVS